MHSMRTGFGRARSALLLAVLMLLLVAVAPSRVAAQVENVVINEIQVSTASVDWEFIELTGAPGTDLSSLTLLVIESDAGTAMGTIDKVVSLAGQSIPDDGYWVGASPAGAAAYGITPDLSFPNDTFENSTTSYLLVTDFTGAQGNDLDADNDGVLDTTPWSAVVDGITITDGGAGDAAYAGVVFGPDGTFLPSGTFRCPNGPGGTFDGNLLNFDTPDGTPGAANPCDAPPPSGAVAALSEIRIDQPSTDNDEYFELTGEPGTALDGLTYLVIGDGTGGSGVIEEVTDLAGQVIPASGFFVAAEGTFTFGTADFVTDLNFENNDNVTHMLVRDFTGADGADLDTNDDGTLDVTPWSEIVECVALLHGGPSELTYCDTTIGPDGPNVPGHVFKCEDGWRIGNFNGGEDTPNAANACEVAPPPDELVCGDPATLISQIQGSGDASPLAGQQHVIEGIVVGDFQGGDGDPFNTNLEGFYVQEELADQDADPATSEGIFVHAPTAADVAPGDIVRVAGTVQEFFGLTELTNVTGLVDCGDAPLPDPVDVTNVDVDEFERYEGMLVRFPQQLYIAEYFNYDRFGEIKLCTERLFQPTAVHEPGSPEAIALAEHNADVCITLDDARSEQNPDPAYHPNGDEFTLDNLFRGGDIVQNAVGILDYRFDLYRLQPTQGADFIVANPRPAAPHDVGGRLQVAAFNVLNYFTTLNSRGANDPAEFDRQEAKIVAAITAMDAEVVGVMEIENNVTAIATLVDALNAAAGAGTYAYIDTGIVGTDEITVGIIYQPAEVTPLGEEAILTDPSFTDPLGSGEQKSRPAIAQTFMENATGERFTVVVNHLKSKGSECAGDFDPMQGNCNITRTLAAEALVDWLATDPTGSGDPDFLIIGDLNAYDKEDPIDAVREGADDTLGTADDYVDLLFQFGGEFAYTYVFDGQLGYLDYALANMSLLPQVTGATAWHINTDEPDLIDYDMTFKQDAQDALYAPDPYRASDHDPVIVGLDLVTPNQPPVCTAAAPSVSVLWPANHQFVAVEILGVTDPEGDAITITIDSVFSDEPVIGPGSGNFAPDAQGIGTSVVELRAERDGGGNGRVYHVNFTATDANGASCSGTVLVSVPQNQSPNGAAVDDGPLYDAALPE